jgi:uncharacterized protein (TIGR03663 family)
MNDETMVALEKEPASDPEPAPPDAAVEVAPASPPPPASPMWAVGTGLVAALSVVLHFWELGLRPLAHDEAIDAWFSWQAHTTRLIEYDPVYHGPLRFYLEGLILGNFGTTPAWARTLAAIAGVAATVLIATSHRLLGRGGALTAALLFTISPTCLTVTRTGREDSLVALVSLAVLLLVARSFTAPKARHIVWAAVLIAVMWTLKETVLIFGFAGAVFLGCLALVAARRADGAGRRFYTSLRQLGAQPWMWATVVFVAVTTFVFSAAFQYGAGFASGMIDGVRYWLSQHDVGRGSQQWHFYLTIYLGYEWLLLLFAAAGVVVTVRRRSMVGAWFLLTAAVQFAVYSWAGEKFAWLAIHPLLPVVLLAGLGGQAVIGRVARMGSGPQTAVATTAGLLAAATLLIAIPPAITDGDDPRELLVTVQTDRDLARFSDRLREARAEGRLGKILIDERDSGSWPWVWYLHGVDDVLYVTLDPTQSLPEGYDAYIVSGLTDPPVIPEGYVMEPYAFRNWWLPDYGKATPGDLLRWFFTRQVWSPTGHIDQYMIVRQESGVVTNAGTN